MSDSSPSLANGHAPNSKDREQPDMQSASAAMDDLSTNLSHASPNISAKRDLNSTAPHNSRASAIPRNQSQSVGPPSSIHSLNVSRSPSLAASPRSSRDSSPAGPPFRHTSSTGATSTASRGMRSRKNSHDVSPQRPPSSFNSTVPSAAAIQRALSQTVPQLQPSITSDINSRLPRAQKTNGISEERERPSWPVSPRLKSPPPATSSRRGSKNSPRKVTENVDDASESSDMPTPKASSRATSNNAPALETVQETTPPVTTDTASILSSEDKKPEYFSFTSDEDRPSTALHSHENSFTGSSKHDPIRSSSRSRTSEETGDLELTPKPKLSNKDSLSKLDMKSGTAPVSKNMTVETETINSGPQAALGAPTDRSGSGRVEPGGTLRVKASNETIRPKKERKKATRKAPSANVASSSTRADIFEDRVKNAMDEATSDDSDETFVGASLASMAERSGLRSIANVFTDQQRTVSKTRSMKFSSNNSNYGTADEETDNRDGTIRARDRARSNVANHAISGQRTVTGQSIPIDDDNNIVPLSKTKSLTAVGARGSYAARLAAQNLRHTSTMRKNDGYSSLDIDAEGADDERTPLMGTVRTPRSNRTARRYRYIDNRPPPQEHRRSVLARLAGILLILVTVSLLAFGVVCFLFAMSKPLMDVQVLRLESIIASEQEIMMDVVVQAVNPNLVPITVTDMDLHIFALSKYAGSEKWWREHGQLPEPDPNLDKKRKDALIQKRDAVRRRENMALPGDFGNIIISDPKPQDPPSGQTMLLGAVLKLDNPLVFDGSFWKRQPLYTTGSIRLSKPGNHSEAGGTERWEHVLKHDFELIIRGVLKYNIPLGGKTISVPISGNKSVEGNGGEEDDDDGDEDEWHFQ
ncbi:hypothetical protein BT63DRAFT_209495 [Microthyrium microscopicum]|uniref:Phospholipid metabolism enzyme regulator n=1 Tax=Microthyrium microscopicum TaxID=703497 RepID=A0A6A6UFT9_9PEZI|nr:hypothetical protein BT63DRAFT_209495 [Microthyrium microscopicum]